jgi:hypothetical protein
MIATADLTIKSDRKVPQVCPFRPEEGAACPFSRLADVALAAILAAAACHPLYLRLVDLGAQGHLFCRSTRCFVRSRGVRVFSAKAKDELCGSINRTFPRQSRSGRDGRKFQDAAGSDLLSKIINESL